MRELTAQERRRLLRAETRYKEAQDALAKARRDWADVVRRVTAAAAARELGITRQAVADRLKVARRIEDRGK